MGIVIAIISYICIFSGWYFLPLSYPRAARPVFVAGVICLSMACIILANVAEVNEQNSIDRIILAETNLAQPLLVDFIPATNTSLYLLNDTEARIRVTISRTEYKNLRSYYEIISAEPYAKPGNLSENWKQISKSIIPDTRKTFPPVARCRSENNATIYEINGQRTYAKAYEA